MAITPTTVGFPTVLPPATDEGRSSAPSVHRVTVLSFRDLLITDSTMTIESWLLRLVNAVRDEEPVTSERELRRAATRRRRRLGVLSLGAGPLSGMANQVSELYCDAATLVELDGCRRLELSDAWLAAHLLVLWGVFGDLPGALAAVEGRGHGVSLVLRERARSTLGGALPEQLSLRGSVSALWRARAILGQARDVGSGAVRTTVFAGRAVDRFIAAADAQLRAGELIRHGTAP